MFFPEPFEILPPGRIPTGFRPKSLDIREI